MKKQAAAHPPIVCARFHHASELIGRRWTGAIIYVLLKSRCRFAVLRDAIPDITDRMLSDRLQELEQEGIVERTVVPEIPVRVEYALTKKGRALASAIDKARGIRFNPLEMRQRAEGFSASRFTNRIQSLLADRHPA